MQRNKIKQKEFKGNKFKRESIMNNSLIAVCIIIGWVSLGLGSALTFDELVQLEYYSYLTDWKNDGKPRGVFWFPIDYWGSKNFNWFSSTLACQRLSRIWLFSTPQWMKKDEEAMKLIKRFRILNFICGGSIILGFISIMMIGIFFS
jgi:hypothetical protein